MAETKKEPEKILFSKEQIVSSMRYKKYRDFLAVSYTHLTLPTKA